VGSAQLSDRVGEGAPEAGEPAGRRGWRAWLASRARRAWPSSRDKRAALRWLGAAGALALFVAAAWLPWEWSFIDDTNVVAFSEWQERLHGPVGGLLPAAENLYRVDRVWGLFRPAWWISVMPFYQLPVGAAHSVRLAEVAIVFLGAISIVVRGTTGRVRAALGVWTALVVLSVGSLFAGVWYPSLQELSGLCFVGLGLLAWRRPWLVAVCWLVAAWFKAPFAWLLLAFGLLLLMRRGTRTVGAVAALAAAGTLAAAAWFARAGWYTRQFATTDVGAVGDRAFDAVRALARPGLVVLLGAVLLLPRLRWRFDPPEPQWPLLAGGLGYLANLLPWRVEGYYAGPFVFLLSVGALLLLRDIRPLSRPRLAAALILPLLVAAHGFGRTVQQGWNTHATVTGLRDCVLRLPDDVTVGFNRPEGWLRLDEIVRRHRPDWSGRVTHVPDGGTAGRTMTATDLPVDYYIHQPSYGPGSPSLMTGPVVCRTPQATMYEAVI
jgi:hypothetical protein